MDRRNFIRAGVGAAGLGLALQGVRGLPADAAIPDHVWDQYPWRSGPAVPDRLYQGPFSSYGADATAPGAEVVMATTPSSAIVSNFGMGLVAYVSGDTGPPRIPGQSLERSIEDLIALPFVQKVYLRPNWREIQQQPGRLDFPDWWHITFDIARHYNKRIGFRIMLENPDFPEPGMPAFLMNQVPYVPLKGVWKGDRSEVRYRKRHAMPRYEHPAYQAAFDQLNMLLAAELNGHPQIEYMDTMMYGFWGEGHSWPFEGNAFTSNSAAERTWLRMFEVQLKYWTKTPLVTNTQPDFNNVGNSLLLDRTVRTNNWIRSDTIFIENTQIEALSNRPPWIAAISEVGMTTGAADKVLIEDGVTYNEQIISHVLGVAANYWSVWNWHNEAAANVLSYYERFPEPIDRIARRIGYRVYPSFIWAFKRDDTDGIVIGLANDGVASAPGVVRLTLVDAEGRLVASGCLDAGKPRPTGIAQAMLMLPPGVPWAGLRLKAALEVKSVTYPLMWACQQKLNADGSLTLRRNIVA